VKARITLGAALVCAALAVPAAAVGSAKHATSNSQSYPDSIGEDPNAPDITSVDVSNDNAGNITFKVNVSNRPTFTPDMLVLMFLNTDGKSSTGDPQNSGADYAIQLSPPTQLGPASIGLFQWNGTTYVAAPSQTSLTYAYAATGPIIHVNAADLGNTRSLGFDVQVFSGITYDASGNPVLTNAHADVAPDLGHGLYTYPVLVTVTLKQTAFATAPSPARAGRRFSASLAASESDTSGPVAKATVTCSAVVGGKRLPATHTLANGVASCYWKLPKTAKGKTLHGTVTIAAQGAKLVKSFAARVR
jgi:hypothetical protein